MCDCGKWDHSELIVIVIVILNNCNNKRPFALISYNVDDIEKKSKYNNTTRYIVKETKKPNRKTLLKMKCYLLIYIVIIHLLLYLTMIHNYV